MTKIRRRHLPSCKSKVWRLSIFTKNWEGLETYDIDKTAVREEKDYTELKILGYEVKQKFSIILPSLDRYTTLMEKLLKIANVSDIDSKFDVAQRKEIESALMAEACANANLLRTFVDSVLIRLSGKYFQHESCSVFREMTPRYLPLRADTKLRCNGFPDHSDRPKLYHRL
jgi:hypothetical protein